jgi:hypothetical protein
MRIISHRGNGFGKVPNSIEAFEASFVSGFGIETDVRDYCGKIVVSHDVARGDRAGAEKLFELAAGFPNRTLAVNIKSDGIGGLLKELLCRYQIKNYFAFDMSVPQMLEYRDNEIRLFSRKSEYETTPVLLKDAEGVWVDAFHTDAWIDSGLLHGYLSLGKQVCIVSPELHGRNHLDLWNKLQSIDGTENVMLCTDRPVEADTFFNGRL